MNLKDKDLESVSGGKAASDATRAKYDSLEKKILTTVINGEAVKNVITDEDHDTILAMYNETGLLYPIIMEATEAQHSGNIETFLKEYRDAIEIYGLDN